MRGVNGHERKIEEERILLIMIPDYLPSFLEGKESGFRLELVTVGLSCLAVHVRSKAIGIVVRDGFIPGEREIDHRTSDLYKPPKIIANHFLSEFEAGASYHPGCLTIDQSTNHKP